MANQRKLTNRDLADIFYKLLEGETVHRIADSYCVSAAAIYDRFKNSGVEISRITVKHRSGIYPNLGNWMSENKISLDRFSKAVGMSYQGLRNFLYGKSNPKFETIQNILKITGLTYEEAFATNQSDAKEES